MEAVMKSETCKITVLGETKEYACGTTYKSIAEEYQKCFEHDIVLAFVDGKLQELRKKAKRDCRMEFVTTADPIGNLTYRRSMSLLLVKAVHDVCGHDSTNKVRILFSVSKGFYCVMDGKQKIDRSFLQAVEMRMHELVKKKQPIEKESLHTDEALARFREHGMYDKELLFKYRRVSMVNIYRLNEFEDYNYGYMVPDAGYLKYFALYPFDEGFVIQMPEAEAPEIVPPFEPQLKLFQVLKESTRWGDMQNIETVGQLNEKVTSGDLAETILVQEALQEKKIAEIATMIAERPEVKFILIAGPSSSGKTTFSRRLSIQLRVNGLVPHAIGVDDYFKNREDSPRDADGNYNFECLEAIDREQFNTDLELLLAGKRVNMPTYNFKTGKREYRGNSICLGENDVLVIEGIHCLNDELTYKLAADKKFKIYISALTQLNIDEHNRIPTTDGRLLRRIVRDARTRGTSAARTIAMWPSVRRGEEENIFTYQEEADVMFNSALIYELAVLKQYAEPVLFGIERDCPEYTEAKRLLKFLDYFVGCRSELVPTNSLLREFIGGSCFEG